MLSKSHLLSRYKANSGKNDLKKCLIDLTLKIGSLSLAIDIR